MTPVVVDASVAVKWFIPENGSERAAALLRGDHQLLAPDLLWVEVANVVWKIARLGSITGEEAGRMLQDAGVMPVEIAESLPLLPDALRIATAADRSAYDSLSVALASRERSVVLTADRRLVNALSGTMWAGLTRHLDDV